MSSDLKDPQIAWLFATEEPLKALETDTLFESYVDRAVNELAVEPIFHRFGMFVIVVEDREIGAIEEILIHLPKDPVS
jgi:hypothetical protein